MTNDVPDNVTRAQRLRVFFAVDLCGADDFKHRWPAEEFDERLAWPEQFSKHFDAFGEQFMQRLRDLRSSFDDAAVSSPPWLWTVDDDMLIWVDLIQPSKEPRDALLSTAVQAFVETVPALDADYVRDRGLGVRGCIWTAGFPYRNRTIFLQQGGFPDLGRRHASGAQDEDDQGIVADDVDHEFGTLGIAPSGLVTFIGRDMDLGRELLAATPPGCVACSLDLAQFVLDIPRRRDPPARIWHVGWRRYPGVFGGMPYPTLLMTREEKPRPRHAWDDVAPDGAYTSPEVLRLLALAEQGAPLTRAVFSDLAGRLREANKHLIRPYASDRDMPAEHRTAYAMAREAMRISADALIDAERQKAKDRRWIDIGAVPPITTDELTLLLLRLQEHPELAPQLAEVLRQVGQHESYIAWAAEDQFWVDDSPHASLYRLDTQLTFRGDDETHDARRRLLENYRLVQEDGLRVKIHVRDDHVFITDGLWVSPSVRVYPFSDEADLVVEECRTLGWLTANVVVDPGARAGHSVLRVHGASTRWGFDRNPRAVVFAEINAILNGINNATFALHSVGATPEPDPTDDEPTAESPVGEVAEEQPEKQEEHRTHAKAGAYRGTQLARNAPPLPLEDADSLLMVATMPFALAPGPTSIARSADGGRHGLQRTLAAMRALREYAAGMQERATARGVFLVYSVGRWGGPGSADEPEWEVVERANRIFSIFAHQTVEWRLLRDKKLWRINGRKQEQNPMPLDRLATKAECRYYVRASDDPDEVRRDYEQLAASLSEKGWTHLAYGLVTVEIRGPKFGDDATGDAIDTAGSTCSR